MCKSNTNPRLVQMFVRLNLKNIYIFYQVAGICWSNTNAKCLVISQCNAFCTCTLKKWFQRLLRTCKIPNLEID